MKICIITPTYNEKENIALLLDELLKVFNKTKYEMNILVVDDNSPDGTADIVKKYCSTYKNVHLITGNKEGLGKAYIRGFNHVLNNMKMDAIIMMDADFSHDPKYVPDFLKNLDKYNFIIGSRYIKGGKIPDWPFYRRIISAGGNFFARIISGLYGVHDCTTGYRCIKTELLKKIDFDKLDAKGYAFMSTLLFEAKKEGAEFKEIPITFYDRKRGKPKLSYKDMVEFFFNSFKLRIRSITGK
ncbi:polyprenol monophosphomannose synthase [Candidatus Woesearchaeota archaeon]|nr:polyprenol monophosphomannose synthase [Candidatus Woesearchaeota archaeon]